MTDYNRCLPSTTAVAATTKPQDDSVPNGGGNNTSLNLVASVEATAAEVVAMVRDFVEVLRIEFRPQTQGHQQQQEQLKDVPLYTRMKTRGLPEKIRSITHRAQSQEIIVVGLEEEKPDYGEELNDNSNGSSSFEVQRRKVLEEVSLPLAELIACCYGILDDLPEDKPIATKSSCESPRSRGRKDKNRPAPPRGMLSIQDYTDVACLLEFIVCTGIIPPSNDEPEEASSTSNNSSSRIEDRLRTKLPKSLAGRIPKDALRWGTTSSSSSNNKSSNLSLLVRATDMVTRVVILDRFRPMLLPRHLVDIYGACFKIEYLAAKKENTVIAVGTNHYRALGLSLPPSSMISSPNNTISGKARLAVVVDPTLRVMAYQALLSSSPQPQGTTTNKKNQNQQHHRYHPWLQKRVSGLLTDLATTDLRGLSAILTVFVPVLSSSTDQTSLMSGASQRLGRTLAAMTASAKDSTDDNKGKKKLQGRLCQQLLQLLGVVFPATQKGKETTANAGIQPRSMAVIQTAWAFFEHLSQPTIQQFVLGSWASRLLLVDESTTGGIHETIRQVGALCTFVPPHSKSPLKFLRRAAYATNDSFRDSTLLGQILRVMVVHNGEPSAVTGDAEQTLLMLTHAIYAGSSDTSLFASNEEEEIAKDKVVSIWLSALGPTQWDLVGHSYAYKKLPVTGGRVVETIKVQKHRPLVAPTPMEEFAASVQSTTTRSDFFVDKILLVLAPPSNSAMSTDENVPSFQTLQGLPSRIFRLLLKQYLSRDNREHTNGNMRLVATVLLPILCEKCSQEQLLFGDHRDNASGLLLLIRQVLSELADARPSEDDNNDHRHEFLKSIAGILTSLLIALMEVGSKTRSKEEEDLLQSFLPTLQSLSVATSDTYYPEGQNDRKDDAAMADMAAYAMALIASRSFVATDDNKPATQILLSPEDRLRNILEEAEKDLGSTQAPIRAKAMVSLGRLARGFTGALTKEQNVPSLIQELDETGKELSGLDETMANWIERVLELSMVALGDNESYVYLAAIQTIVAVGDLHPRRVLPKIASAIVQSQLQLGGSDTNSGKFHRAEPIQLSQEQVIKLAEALMFIIRRRAVTDEYIPILANLMLRGGSSRTLLTETSAKNDAPIKQDPQRIQRETDNYFVAGRIQNEETTEEAPDDGNALTKKELWEEQDIRVKTGGPVFDIEEAEIVRSLRISVLSELVASSASQAVAPYVGSLTRLAIEALHLEGRSRIVQRSAARLARELYARVLREAIDLSDALGDIEDLSASAVAPISIALVESDEEALSATLRAIGSGKSAPNNESVADSTVVARCKEAIGLRDEADQKGVFLASKLVLEEHHKLKELPVLFQGLDRPSEGNDANAITLNPIETLH